MSAKVNLLYEFGPYRLDTAARTLTNDGEPVSLAPKTFDLLVLMVESRGSLLSRTELLHTLWEEAVVEEGNLTYQISTLRKILGPENAAWIQTVSKHGYRFLASVEPLTASLPASAAPPARAGERAMESAAVPWRWLAPAAICFLVAAGLWIVGKHVPAKPPAEPIHLTA